jgi:hypothetical protein
MKLFNYVSRREATLKLVQHGLSKQHSVSDKAVADCLHLMASGYGESWDSLGTEPAAGMALVALVKNASLSERLSSRGWELVYNLLDKHPGIATSISPRARAEIAARDRHNPALMAVACA